MISFIPRLQLVSWLVDPNRGRILSSLEQMEEPRVIISLWRIASVFLAEETVTVSLVVGPVAHNNNFQHQCQSRNFLLMSWIRLNKLL